MDNQVLVFGGRTDVNVGEGNLNDLWSFDVDTHEWTHIEAGGAPAARSFHRAAAAGSKLYIFGGCGADGRLADLHEFDTATDVWSELVRAQRQSVQRAREAYHGSCQ